MVSLYPEIVMEEDLSPELGSGVDEICLEINSACRGFGTDEDRLLKAMGSLTPEMRHMVPIRYKEIYGKELRAVMKSECGNRDFGTALQFLALSPCEAECFMIKKACRGLGTNELLLTTLIVGRNNEEMELLKRTFFNVTDKDLGRVLDGELGGHYEQLVFNALQASEEPFDPDYHNEEKVDETVKEFYKMGQGKWGTDESGLFKLICAAPPEHLKAVNLAYAEKYGYTLSKAMEEEVAGRNAQSAAVFLLGMKLKPIATIAKLIHDAVRGFGTNELLLSTTLIRYQLVLDEIKEAYENEYETTLEETIHDETGGDYRKLLLEIVKSKAEESSEE